VNGVIQAECPRGREAVKELGSQQELGAASFLPSSFGSDCGADFSTDLKKKRAAELSLGRSARYCR